MGRKNKIVASSKRLAQKYRGTECLNCGHPLDLSDRYCPYCSQLNSTKQLSAFDFFGEFINSIVSYDSRLRHTVKDLLFKPGTITRNYVRGQRMRYANPFRFFLSVSIIYFILQGLINTFLPEENNFFKTETKDEAGVSYSYGDDRHFLDEGENEEMTGAFGDSIALAQASTDSPEKETAIVSDTVVDKQNEEVRDTISEDTEEEEIVYFSEDSLQRMSFLKRNAKRFETYRDFYKSHEIKDSHIALDSLQHEDTFYNRWLYKKNESIERVEENPTGFINYLMNKTPFFVFFFTPFFAIAFWLLYSKKKFTYIEHIIFLFHIFSFVFLGMLISTLPDLLIGNDIFASILFIIIGPFYFYKALRNFYKQSRIVTILKFVFLNIVFWVSATIAALIFFSASAAFY